MKHLAILTYLLLAACAKDNYVPTDGGPTQMSQTLHDCKMAAIHGTNGAGAVIGGVVAGAVGGLLMGIADSADKNPNRRIEECMREHGYEGTSEN